MSRDADEAGIAPRVRAARDRAGLSREALAVKAGVSWSAIAQVESGRRTNLRPGTLASLARALGVTIDYLVAGGPPRQTMLQHRMLLYENEDDFLAGVVHFLSGMRKHSEAAVAILGEDRARRLRAHLDPRVNGMTFVDPGDCYRTPSAALHRHREFVDAALASGATWVRILAEPLWRGGRTKAPHWSRYEALLNLVFDYAPVSVLCLYDAKRVNPSMLKHLQATHPEALQHGAVRPSVGFRDPIANLFQ